MKTIFYSPVWTECGILLSDCWDEHGTIGEADCCIAHAGGYVVAVENSEMGKLGRMRDEDVMALRKALVIRFLALRPQGRCQ